MTALAITLAILCQLFLVTGQLFFKHAMRETPGVFRPKRKVYTELGLGIFAQSLWFFFWINLLKSWDLSRIFPFEGLNPVLLVLAAALVLKEKLSIDTWVGVVLICAGIFFASGTPSH